MVDVSLGGERREGEEEEDEGEEGEGEGGGWMERRRWREGGRDIVLWKSEGKKKWISILLILFAGLNFSSNQNKSIHKTF